VTVDAPNPTPVVDGPGSILHTDPARVKCAPSQMLRIFSVLSDYQGVGWYRSIVPGVALANRGHSVRLEPGLPKQLPDGTDVLVGGRLCLPGPSLNFQRHCRAGQVKTVLELDDDLWNLDPANRRAVDFYTPELLATARRNVEMADLVTTTTPALAERLSVWNRNVAVLPNCVPGWVLHLERAVTDNGRITIGWAGGGGHVRDWGEINKPVRRVLLHPANRDRAELHMIGGPDWTDRVRTPRTTVRHTGWFEWVVDYYLALDFDIGLAPLRPSAFNDAKSDVKLLEYSALGIPAIVSDTGPYRATGGHLAAFRARTPREWEDLLRTLLDAENGRRAFGAHSRKWAIGRTIENNVQLWESAYSAR
jgi:glycosyltransferase involved in cell wall biosynthesis